MPTVYRSMLKDGDGPLTGTDDNMLGVRIPPHKRADLEPDAEGMVHPGGGGMSVNRDWRKMRLNHIPKRLNRIVFDARGSNSKSIWQHGEGDFQEESINDQLCLRIDSANHGLIEPHTSIAIELFQECLAATRDEWREIDV